MRRGTLGLAVTMGASLVGGVVLAIVMAVVFSLLSPHQTEEDPRRSRPRHCIGFGRIAAKE
jgi:hypothetical protein